MSATPKPVARVDAVLRELIPEYLENRRRDVARMRLLCAGGPLEELSRILHQMKGSGGMYGFPRVTELARLMETELAARGPASLAAGLAELEEYVNHVTVVYVED